MITMILEKSRLIDVTVTLSAAGDSSRKADYYQITGVADNGSIVLYKTTDSIIAAAEIYKEWQGEKII